MVARFAPACEASSTARLTASASPEITVWSGEFKFAGAQTWPWAARLQTSVTTAGESPMIAAMAPWPAGTVSCIWRRRLRPSRTAPPNFSERAATSAEYSPRLWPATKSGASPFSSSTRYVAIEQVKIAGCVFAVSFRSSSEPSKHIFEMENPSALSASSKTALADGYISASSLPMPGYCEACPGKTNATLPICLPVLCLSHFWRANTGTVWVYRSGRKLLFDFVVHLRTRESRGDANSIFNSVGVGSPVADNAHSAYAKQRRATIFGVVDGLLQTLQRSTRKKKSHLRCQRTLYGLFQQTENFQRQAFTNFKRDVADKPVAYDHIHNPRKKIPAFHIAHEMHGTFLQARVHFARQFVAFDFLFADRQQPDSRPPVTKRRAVVHFTHHRELHQMLRLGIHVGANIEQNRDAAFGVRKRRGQCHPVHRFQRTQQKPRHGHDRAGISSTDQAIRLRLANQARRHMHGAVLLPAKRLRRMIIHGDHFAGGHDLNRQVGRGMLGEVRAQRIRLPHKDDAHAVLACR